jgi:hypothetical protein
MKVDGSGEYQCCPRCGTVNRVHVLVYASGEAKKCFSCSWKVRWVGPLFGEALR